MLIWGVYVFEKRPIWQDQDLIDNRDIGANMTLKML